MVLTIVIACLLTLGKWVRIVSPRGNWNFQLLLLSLAFGVVGVAAVGMVLAPKRVALYCVGVVVVGACVGYGFGRISDFGLPEFWMNATVTEAITLVLSLLVVRSGGYRLMRLPRHDHARAPG